MGTFGVSHTIIAATTYWLIRFVYWPSIGILNTCGMRLQFSEYCLASATHVLGEQQQLARGQQRVAERERVARALREAAAHQHRHRETRHLALYGRWPQPSRYF